MKHTSGPWRAIAASKVGKTVGIYDADGGLIAKTGNRGSAKADARLIAAAPELLEVLKAAEMPLALYRAYGWPDRDGVLNKVKASIAKATGSEA